MKICNNETMILVEISIASSILSDRFINIDINKICWL